MNIQGSFDFEKKEAKWPDQKIFPINWKENDRKVITVIKKDIENAVFLKIATGFTSLGYIVDFSHEMIDYDILKKVDIVLGFEPDRIQKRREWSRVDLENSIKDYWLERGFSVFKSAALINAIEKIKQGVINFKLLNKLHAKVYVTDISAMLGSSNFSKNGLYNQIEANFRVEKENDNHLYEYMHTIINNYLESAYDYNQNIIALLEKLLIVVTWQEALSKGVSDLLEDHQLKDYPELLQELNEASLWPSQRIALAQALNIIKEHGNVLIAEPTGSGKTKLISSLRLLLTHWRIETRMKNRVETIIICPKLVEGNWESESIDLSFLSGATISMGLLSKSSKKNRRLILQKLQKTDLLIIDEAHNFLSINSQRSQQINAVNADNIILSTATPINKKAKDLLRLIELLDIDNLEDHELKEYIHLKKTWTISSPEQIESLRSHIWKFTVRRTKRELKKLIQKEPESYLNKRGKECSYPKLKSLTYLTN
ncbi:MAG: SNF2-related protein [Saprospiraceae bacterium]